MRFDPDAAHDDNLDDDCMCRRCRYSSIQFSGQRRRGNSHNSNPELRPMMQPNDPVFLMDRPGGHQVPVLVDGGRAMRVSEKSKYRRQITELQQRTQAARNQT